MPTFCQPIVFVLVNHPDGKTSRPHVRLCLPDTTTFEEAFTAALAVEDAGERDGFFLLAGLAFSLGRVGRRPQTRTLNLTSTLPSLINYMSHKNLIFHDSLNKTQLNYFACEFNCECWRTTISHLHNELFTHFWTLQSTLCNVPTHLKTPPAEHY